MGADDAAGRALTIGQRLGPYEVEGRLGAGGMGVVYRARDTRLNRPVAIKLLSDDAEAAARSRFQREAQTASSLNHPHILTVLDAGEVDGRQYLVTEFIDGGTLRDWLQRGPHDWRAAVELLVGVADGLATAHEAGILHRDIKPENILVTKSAYAKLADFGLAKPVEADPNAATVTDFRTRQGAIVGTAAYMSPEQARGQPLDARSDVFSFGAVLYEALAARRPFAGDSAIDVMHAIAYETPAPLPGAVPPMLRSVVEKALEKEPANRFQSMREFVVDLRRLIRQSGEPADAPIPQRSSASSRPPSRRRRRRRLVLVTVLAALAAAGVLGRYRRAAETPSRPGGEDIRSIAVLPLENLSGDSAQEYLVEGIREAVTTDLARLGIEKVIAKSSSDAFKSTTKAPAEIGRELGADGLLTGSVTRSGTRVQVRAQLVRAATGTVVWANRFDRNADDLPALESDVVSAIAREVQSAIVPGRRVGTPPPRRVDPGAYDAYLKARWSIANFIGTTDLTQLDASIAQYERAIQMDPTYAPAYAGLSWAYQNASQGSWRAPKDTFPRARTAALKAVELDDQLAAAHAALAGVFLWYDWNWSGAEHEIQRALQINPDSVDALTASEIYLTLVAARADEAEQASRRIIDVDPLNPFSRLQPIWVALYSRRFDDAMARAKTLIEVSPGNLMGPFLLSGAAAAKGMRAEAVEQCRRTMEILSGAMMMQPIAECAGALGRVGDRAGADALLRRLQRPPSGVWVDPLPMGDAYAAIDAAKALQWYQRGLDERSPNMIYLRTGWSPDPLRGDPRFQAILDQLNFPR